MGELLNIEAILTRECGLMSARNLVVAVSGGPDSLALLHRLTVLAPRFGWRLHVAHLDHGLRGAQSTNEARFVAVTAAAWGLSATIELRDVGALAKEYNVGLPAAARAARYSFLADVALAQKADAVVVGHQADDQAETVLLHLLRGSGPSGLSGMRPRLSWADWQHTAGRPGHSGPSLVRPLLFTSRAEIEEYCTQHQLEPRRDPTNASTEYSRGRIRHELLPQLETYNPQVVAALGRTARIAADEAACMHEILLAAWPALTTLESGSVHFDRAAWGRLHPALRRLALREATKLLRPERDELSATQLDGVLQAIESEQIVYQLPQNLVLHRRPQGWTLTMATTTRPSTDDPQLLLPELLLSKTGSTSFPDGRWRITVEAIASRPETNLTRWQVLLDADAIMGDLMLRTRQPGERIRPAGGIGSRRIQDVMVDLKLPRELRTHWPMLADAAGVLWIPELVVAEHAHPSPDTTTYLLVSLEEITTNAS